MTHYPRVVFLIIFALGPGWPFQDAAHIGTMAEDRTFVLVIVGLVGLVGGHRDRCRRDRGHILELPAMTDKHPSEIVRSRVDSNHTLINASACRATLSVKLLDEADDNCLCLRAVSDMHACHGLELYRGTVLGQVVGEDAAED